MSRCRSDVRCLLNVHVGKKIIIERLKEGFIFINKLGAVHILKYSADNGCLCFFGALPFGDSKSFQD